MPGVYFMFNCRYVIAPEKEIKAIENLLEEEHLSKMLSQLDIAKDPMEVIDVMEFGTYTLKNYIDKSKKIMTRSTPKQSSRSIQQIRKDAARRFGPKFNKKYKPVVITNKRGVRTVVYRLRNPNTQN